MKLLKVKPKGEYINRVEWWLIARNHQVGISFGSQTRSVFVLDENGNDITSKLALRLGVTAQEDSGKYLLTRTIDSYFIQSPIDKLDELLRLIEEKI